MISLEHLDPAKPEATGSTKISFFCLNPSGNKIPNWHRWADHPEGCVLDWTVIVQKKVNNKNPKTQNPIM